jgi:hypothetical protein
MTDDTPAYGLWTLVILNSAIFLMFAYSFFKPQTKRDWRTFSAFGTFVVALFVGMYGFPLTIYLMWGWLQTKFPKLDLLSHDTGHLRSTLLGEKGDPHFGVLHIASYVFLAFGFYLLANAWDVLYQARQRNPLKQWKTSPIDAVAVKHRNAYSDARDAMLLRTHTPIAPWHIVKANDKRLARLNLIRDILSRLHYAGKKNRLVQPDTRIAFEFTPDCMAAKRLAR